MPIYEYRCAACGKITELLAGMGDDRKPKCDHCGSTRLEKIMSVSFSRVGSHDHSPDMACGGQEDACDISACDMAESCQMK